MTRSIRWLVCVMAVVLGAAQHAHARGGELLACGFNSDQIHRYDATTGAFVGTFGAGGDLNGPICVTVGPDGLLYVCSEEANKVLRYHRTTYAYIDEFIFDDPGTPMVDETGGLLGPTAAIFGPDGNLYVASFDNDQVLRYNGTTGAFIDVFVTAASGGLNGPDNGTIFGPDGHLYVPSYFGNQVLRFDGTSGAFLNVFVGVGSAASAMRNPRTVLFRYGCNDVMVNNELGGRVQRYNAATGVWIDRFIANVPAPTGMAIGPDKNLYIASLNNHSITKWSGVNGATLGTFVPSGSGGLNGVVYIKFLPLTGDANCDGVVSIADLDGFVQLLLDPVAYAIAHPNCDAANADVTGDNATDGLDISAFLTLIQCP